MRIAWFTPFPPEKSAIGEYSATIVAELLKFCDVDIWVSLSDRDDINLVDERYGKSFTIINFNVSPERVPSLASYDAVVYNMGNNLQFHKDIYEVSREYPGIVILHDYVLHHFFAGYHLDFKGSNEAYIKDMEWNHGAAGRQLAKDIVSGKAPRVWETDDVLRYPLNRSALDNSPGVITHSSFVKDKIRGYYRHPVRRLNFPTPPLMNLSDGREARRRLGIPDDRILILTFGEVNPNKRIDKVITMLGRNPHLAENIIYAVVGREHRGYYDIRPLIEKCGLSNIRVAGYQPKETLIDYISACDICMNLRNPTMGESSWSLLQVLFAGKVAFVTRTGWYDELPDDVVVKVDPESEEESLSAGLHALCGDRELRTSMGFSAKRFAQDTFSTKTFCEELVDFVAEVKQHAVTLRLIDSVSDELISMGVPLDTGVIDVVAGELSKMTKAPSSGVRGA